jgi:DNA-binding NarL/FixJ family response regulator
MKIIIADDHEIVRRGLEQLIGRQRDWSVTAVVSADELVRAVRADRYDVIVLDVSLGDRSGVELLPSLRSEFPDIPVLILSMHDEAQYAIRCLRAGAAGYVQKDRSGEQILEAITRVASGRRYISTEVAEYLADDAVEGRPERAHDRLSIREFEVFRRLALGESVTEIAQAMSVSVKTVSTFRMRALEKLRLRTNADIVRYAVEHELI